MKALKTLKEKAFVIPANGNKIYKAEDIDEAISELEALQQQADQVRMYLDLALNVSSYQDAVEAIKQAKKALGAKQ